MANLAGGDQHGEDDARLLEGLSVGKGCIRYGRPEQMDPGVVRALLAGPPLTRSLSASADCQRAPRGQGAYFNRLERLRDRIKLETAAENIVSSDPLGRGNDLIPRHVRILTERTVWGWPLWHAR